MVKVHSAAPRAISLPFSLQLVKFGLPMLLHIHICMSDRGMWGDIQLEAGSIGPTEGRGDTEAENGKNFAQLSRIPILESVISSFVILE